MNEPTQKNALAAAMLDMPEVAELDATNPHKKYKYASVDSLYKAVRFSLASQGLSIWFQELEFNLEPNVKGSLFIHATYELGFQTDPQQPPPEESRERITLVSAYFDVQSCQAIRTYAQKYWLRTKCMMATGELDLDDTDQSESPPQKRNNGHSLTSEKKAEVVDTKPAANGQGVEEKQPVYEPTFDGKWNFNKKTKDIVLTGNFPTDDYLKKALTDYVLDVLFVVKDRNVAETLLAREVMETNLDMFCTTLSDGEMDPLTERFTALKLHTVLSPNPKGLDFGGATHVAPRPPGTPIETDKETQ